MSWKRNRFLLFTFFVFATEVLFALYNPLFHNADEYSHLQRVQYRYATGRSPDPYALLKVQQDKHPDYTYLLSAWILGLSDGWFSDPDQEIRLPGRYELIIHPGRVDSAMRRGDLLLRLSELLQEEGKMDRDGRALTVFDPPYQKLQNEILAMAAGQMQANQAEPEARRLFALLSAQEPRYLVRDGQVYLLRFFMLLHWCLLALFLLRLADFVWPDKPRFAFSFALCVAWIPQAALTGAALTPDVTVSAFCTVAFYYLVRFSQGFGRDRSEALLFGFFFALALLSKSAAICLLPALGFALFRRSRDLGFSLPLLKLTLWSLAPAVLLAAWWYVRNLVLYGDPFQMLAQVETYTHSVQRSPLTRVFHEVFWEDSFRTFFGYWHREILLPRPFFYLFAGLLGIAGAGLMQLASPRVREAETEPLQRRIALLAAIPLLTMIFLSWLGNHTVYSPQGRYLYPTLASFLVLTGLGLRLGLRLHRDNRLWYLVALFWWLFLMWSLDDSILAQKAPTRAMAEGEGQVLYYSDCGAPWEDRYKVQGYRAPDQGELGRNTPWRSLVGHPETIIYRYPLPPAWRNQSLQLRVLYFNPDPTTPYTADAVGHFVYTSQRLRVGSLLVHDEIEVTSTPREYFFRLPKQASLGESLELRFEKQRGLGATVSQIWIEKPWLTIQEGEIRNRSGKSLPYRLVWTEGAGTKALVGRLAAHGRIPVPEGLRGVNDLEMHYAERSPWRLFEAESWPYRTARWIGDKRASGGYCMRGEGPLLSLPLDLAPTATWLLRSKDPSGSWVLGEPGDRVQKTSEVWLFGARDGPGSFDYILDLGSQRWR